MTTKHAVKATKMALFEALRDLGWSYTIDAPKDPSGPSRTRITMKTDVIKQARKNPKLKHKIPSFAEYILPTVQLGDFSMIIVLDPTFPVISVVPFDKATMEVDDNEVVLRIDDEVVAVLGRYGKPKVTEMRMKNG